ncbi:LacI family DNA-binding transcriptional regulator [Streptomyces sp. G-G2]|uniref:LacI family DNA-binding transcriptional regulator n=1 Tax=Streptomyces sp. G-G2 TaxID=3046201 RepID=UPI0024BB9F81|nr:LacI family DNA-binding transcriptional regulator [Streptomyces sp. G-G2]MDJ0383108.1 LacI family DNA-binding transcriptional regulator [Streptomyces sp. G-G2]
MDTGGRAGGGGSAGAGAATGAVSAAAAAAVARAGTGAAPTLEDVARAAGVSRATVSRVVNGIRNVDPAIRQAVRRAVDDTGYVPNRAARSLVTRRAGAVALVVSGAGTDAPDEFAARVFQDPFFGRVVSGVVRALRPRGVHPVLMCAETDSERAELVAYLAQGGADGALLVSTHPHDPLPRLLARAGLPAVLFARPEPDVPLPSVDLRHRDGGALAAGHLRERGRRRIAVIAGPADVPASRERVTGFIEAMAGSGSGLAGEPPGGSARPVAVAQADFTVEGGERAMRLLLAQQPDLDGVFAANDLMAQGACLVLHEYGRRVPRDVAVVGFDDSSAATACRPRLTTVRQPVEEMAAEMVRLLLDGEAPTRTPVLFAPELIVRDSA